MGHGNGVNVFDKKSYCNNAYFNSWAENKNIIKKIYKYFLILHACNISEDCIFQNKN